MSRFGTADLDPVCRSDHSGQKGFRGSLFIVRDLCSKIGINVTERTATSPPSQSRREYPVEGYNHEQSNVSPDERHEQVPVMPLFYQALFLCLIGSDHLQIHLGR